EREPRVPADIVGRDWLEAVHRALHRRWADGFLDQATQLLPRSHPVNDPRLATLIRLTVGRSGSIDNVAIAQSSGVHDFDEAAGQVVADASPLPPPPDEVRSDDGNVHLTWRFARDSRQEGVAGATLERREVDLGNAVPLLLSQGRVRNALERIAAAPPSGDGVRLARDAAGAALLRALADAREPGVRIEAAEAIGAARWLPAAATLRKLAEDAPDLALQTSAMRALGAIGDRDSVTLLSASVARLLDDRSAAAAGALAALGEARTA